MCVAHNTYACIHIARLFAPSVRAAQLRIRCSILLAPPAPPRPHPSLSQPRLHAPDVSPGAVRHRPSKRKVHSRFTPLRTGGGAAQVAGVSRLPRASAGRTLLHASLTPRLAATRAATSATPMNCAEAATRAHDACTILRTASPELCSELLARTHVHLCAASWSVCAFFLSFFFTLLLENIGTICSVPISSARLPPSSLPEMV